MGRVILVGNPNTGKTTLYNTLTGASEKASNWHGVTVEIKARKIEQTDHVLYDLPGIYSLDCFSPEEKISVDFLLKNKDKLIVNICDANNLKRNLYLTLSLIENGFKNIALAINMAKEVDNINQISERLSKELNIKVFNIDARTKNGCTELLNYISNFKDKTTSGDFPYKVESVYYCKNCSTFLCKNCNETRVEKKLNEIINNTNEEDFKANAKVKYDKITKILNVCNYNQKSANNRLNKLFCNKFFTLFAFFAIFSLIFILTFGSFGHYLSSFLGSAFERIVNLIFPNLKFQTGNPIVSFVYDGLFGGVVSILSFLPQIALLFFFINFLDDVGIVSRFAFMFDEFFQKFGLSGRSVFNIMMGFGCTTSAIFTTRNIADEKIRKRTALVLPNFSCSAKLPIYACICSAFFAGQKVLVIFGLYLIGVLVGLIIAIILKKISKTKTESTFIMEMPKLRFPRIRKILQDALRSVKDFIIRIGSIILVMSVIVWFISNFTFSLSFEPDSDKIILNVIGSVLSPIFAPLGFGLASIIVALISGLFAKEMIVGQRNYT